MKQIARLALASLLVVAFAGSALAVPRLQTYMVGSSYYGTYGMEHNSWISNSSYFDLKVVGYWRPGAAGTGGSSSLLGCRPSQGAYDYMDCFVAISTPRNQSGHVWINGVEVTSFSNYWNAVPGGVYPSLSLPLSMPSLMGQFNFTSIGRIDNDQMNAYGYEYGSIGSPGWGDELLLNVVVSGYDWAHFDAVGVDSHGRTYTNPMSHDSSYYATPEPGTLSLLGLGLIGVIPLIRRRER